MCCVDTAPGRDRAGSREPQSSCQNSVVLVKVDRSKELVASEFAAVLRQCAAVAANYVAQCDHAAAALLVDPLAGQRTQGAEAAESARAHSFSSVC